jgi:hypothetical protein
MKRKKSKVKAKPQDKALKLVELRSSTPRRIVGEKLDEWTN